MFEHEVETECEAPRKAGKLDNCVARVNDHSERIQQITNTLNREANALFGPIPEGNANDALSTEDRGGTIGRLDDALDRLQSRISELDAAVERHVGLG